MRHILVPSVPGLHKLVHALYEQAYVDLRGVEETVTGHAGEPWSWLLDLRRPLLKAEFLLPTVEAMSRVLVEAGVEQVAGLGLGAAPLVVGIVAQDCGIDGMLIRPQPKRRGLDRVVAGRLDATRPVWLVDDVVNSGKSVLKAARVLRKEGYQPAGILCVFEYRWGGGRRRLGEKDLSLQGLAEVRKRRAK
ncbi:MAG: hypothetical protein ACE5G0_13780 [Rhodothermales bacterium]